MLFIIYLTVKHFYYLIVKCLKVNYFIFVDSFLKNHRFYHHAHQLIISIINFFLILHIFTFNIKIFFTSYSLTSFIYYKITYSVKVKQTPQTILPTKSTHDSSSCLGLLTSVYQTHLGFLPLDCCCGNNCNLLPQQGSLYGQNEQAKPKTLLPVGLPLNVSSIASYCLLKGTPSLIAFILSSAFFIASLPYILQV